MADREPETQPERRLSETMQDTLARIRRLQDEHGACGMFPTGAGQFATLRALEKRGLVRFVGRGVDIDGEREGEELPIWELTAAGREACPP